jgi:hypothetical protein
MSNGMWYVDKDCPINEVYSLLWIFYEDTQELVIRPKPKKTSENSTGY